MRLLAALLLAPAAFAQSFAARHEHLRGSCTGSLALDERGVVFTSETKAKHSWKVAWLDVQQVRLLDTGEIRVLTYQDRRARLGADREHQLRVADPLFASRVSALLEYRLERRFVSGFVPEIKPLWEIPAKHLLRFSGAEGRLVMAADRLQFRAARPGHSRDWMFSDIDNVSSSDPYQLTITTYERARGHFGDRKGFQFRLKERLDPGLYQLLWRAVERSKGLDLPMLADEEKYDR